MSIQKETSYPDYKKIFIDILNMKFPARLPEFQYLLDKDELSVLDVIEVNQKIFNLNTTTDNNQKLKSYDEITILEILNYQRKNKLNNRQLASQFKLSRNTITKWKKLFKIDAI